MAEPIRNTAQILSQAAQDCIATGDFEVAAKLLAILQEGVAEPTVVQAPQPLDAQSVLAAVDQAFDQAAPRSRLPTRPAKRKFKREPVEQSWRKSGANHPKIDEVRDFVLREGRALIPELSKKFKLNAYQVKQMFKVFAKEGLVSKKGAPRTGRIVYKKIAADGRLVTTKGK